MSIILYQGLEKEILILYFITFTMGFRYNYISHCAMAF